MTAAPHVTLDPGPCPSWCDDHEPGESEAGEPFGWHRSKRRKIADSHVSVLLTVGDDDDMRPHVWLDGIAEHDGMLSVDQAKAIAAELTRLAEASELPPR